MIEQTKCPFSYLRHFRLKKAITKRKKPVKWRGQVFLNRKRSTTYFSKRHRIVENWLTKCYNSLAEGRGGIVFKNNKGEELRIFKAG